MLTARQSVFIWTAMALLTASLAVGQGAAAKSKKAETTRTTTTTATTTQTSSTGSEAKSAAASAKLDINSASKDELEKLPGIGAVTAQKIIEGRPYRAKSDLVSRKIIGQSEYEKIKDQIIAHQPKGTTTTAGKSGSAAPRKP
jgi:competence protein ComEA